MMISFDVKMVNWWKSIRIYDGRDKIYIRIIKTLYRALGRWSFRVIIEYNNVPIGYGQI